MFIRKIVLKGASGAYPATIKANDCVTLILPDGVRPRAAAIGDNLFAFSEKNKDLSLPVSLKTEEAIAVLAEREGDLLFGSVGFDSPFLIKFRLSEFASVSNAQKPTQSASEKAYERKGDIASRAPDDAKEEHAEEDVSHIEERECAQSPSKMITEEIENEKNCVTIKVSDRIRKDESFPFLEDAIPGSRWTRLTGEGESGFLGVLSADGEETVLYALEGERNAPIGENAAFYPYPEDEENGCYIWEA